MITAPVRVAFLLALIIAALYGLNWLLQRYLLWLFLMGLFVWTSGCATVAQAAPPAPPSVVDCEPIAQAGVIVVYRCVPDSGLPFLINSVGFMLQEN